MGQFLLSSSWLLDTAYEIKKIDSQIFVPIPSLWITLYHFSFLQSLLKLQDIRALFRLPTPAPKIKGLLSQQGSGG